MLTSSLRSAAKETPVSNSIYSEMLDEETLSLLTYNNSNSPGSEDVTPGSAQFQKNQETLYESINSNKNGLQDLINLSVTESRNREQSICRALSTVIQQADQAFLRLQKCSGSTIVVCLCVDNGPQIPNNINFNKKLNSNSTNNSTNTHLMPLPGLVSRQLFTAHLGDSRAVLCRGGVGIRLTCLSDHRCNDEFERNAVIERGGFVMNERVNGSLSVTRAIGDRTLKAPYLKSSFNPYLDSSDNHTGPESSTVEGGINAVSSIPSITVLDLTPEDPFLILGCDGLWDVLTEQEAVNLVMEAWMTMISENSNSENNISSESKGDSDHHPSRSCQILARLLVEEALCRGSTDNVTVEVVLL